ncbi:MAG: hypothetical protein J3R72DRAFT_449526 [Linnemannia gamsii]|nr:MAG: hypothetical protein J3R72DRAFT_449526 [Linnemannia gamsii]
MMWAIFLIMGIGLTSGLGFLFCYVPRMGRNRDVKPPIDNDPNAVPAYTTNVDIGLQVHPSLVESMPCPTLQDDSVNNIHGGVPPSYTTNTQPPQGSPAVPDHIAVPIPQQLQSQRQDPSSTD